MIEPSDCPPDSLLFAFYDWRGARRFTVTELFALCHHRWYCSEQCQDRYTGFKGWHAYIASGRPVVFPDDEERDEERAEVQP